MLPRALALLAVCAALAAALPLDQYDGDSLEESQQSYAEPVDERQERAAAPWGEEDDLGQQSQQYQQSDDLAQESQQYQQSDDLTQDTQQSDDLTQDTQQSDDFTQDTQQSDDLTQDTQQSDDFTQESQQSDGLTQDTQQYQQSDDLSQETQQSDDISQYSQQTQQEFQEDQRPSWSKKLPQRTDEGLGRSSERLTDSRGSNTNSRDNTGGNNWNTGNTGNTGDNWGTGNNGNNNGPGDNGAGNNGAGNNGAGNNGNSWENGGNRNNGDNTSGFPGSVSVDRPTRPLTPPPDYKKLPPNAFTPLGHYKVYTVAKTWVEAVVTCAADAAELAIAASQQEASEMGKLYKEEKKNVKGSTDKELFFVGASDLAKENDFVTLSGQHFQDGFFFRWQKGEPNNHRKNEHCVLSNEQGLYWDGNCNAKFAFMCRFKTDPCARPPLA